MAEDRRAGDGLELLLDLDDFVAEVGGGYWVRMTAFRVDPDESRPHGIRYSLTLHRPNNERLLGYDNAHLPPIASGPARRSVKRGLPHDHRHVRGRTLPYEFESPGRLLEDFWKDVETLLREEGIT